MDSEDLKAIYEGDVGTYRLAIVNYDTSPICIKPYDVQCRIANIKHQSSTIEYLNPITGELELREIQNDKLIQTSIQPCKKRDIKSE
jgi:hypothetical protein